MARERESRQVREDKGSEWEEKVLYINRTAKVVKGGRKFSFSALILVGDGKGKIGFGFAKANEVSDAIRKGTESARKNLFSFEMEGTTIPHEVTIRWDGAILMMKPAKEGTGIVAGSKVRAVLELARIKDIITKSQGSNNPLNQVRAVVAGLKSLRNKKKCLEERGLSS
jgi:small subunit ribosomal protein S5